MPEAALHLVPGGGGGVERWGVVQVWVWCECVCVCVCVRRGGEGGMDKGNTENWRLNM